MTLFVTESRRRAAPRLNETVSSLRAAVPDSSTPDELATAILSRATRLDRGSAGRMAEAIWHRYCAPTPRSYPEIAVHLRITPQHARRLADRGLGYLRDAPPTVQRGSRLWRAIREGRVL